MQHQVEEIRVALVTIFIILVSALSTDCLAVADTIPPPPPGIQDTITGPATACTETPATYQVDVPVGCHCQWTVDGVAQATTHCRLEITFNSAGMVIITVSLNCDGQQGEPLSMITEVTMTPYVYLGADTTIQQGQTLVLDAGNPGSNYLWSTGDTTQTIEVTQPGNYGVTVSNECGSDSDEISVAVITQLAEENNLSPRIRISGDKLYLDDHLLWKRIRILSIQGAIIYNGEPRNEHHLGGSGIYIIELNSDTNTSVVKVIR